MSIRTIWTREIGSIFEK